MTFGARAAYNKVMRHPRPTAFLLVLAVLVAGVVGGTAGRPAAGSAGTNAKAGRLVAFGSCGNLLGYAKAQASRLVGPWGLGGLGPVKAVGVGVAAPTAAGAATARDSSPQEGVDYSGTNVQEEGVDEPDIVKTNGTTLFAVANGELNAVDVSGAKPRLLDTLKLDAGWSHELLLLRRPPARALARRLLGRAAPGDGRPTDARTRRRSRCWPRSTSPTPPSCASFAR